MHQFHYPNTTVIANRRNPHLAPERLFVAPAGSFSEEPSPQGLTFVTFKPRFVLACFRRFALATETRCARPPEAIVPESAARTLG
jgi:hypothetical protein